MRPRIRELANRMQIRHHSTVELVNRLEAGGFVHRARAQDDQSAYSGARSAADRCGRAQRFIGRLDQGGPRRGQNCLRRPDHAPDRGCARVFPALRRPCLDMRTE
ncbi:MAG: MarR family transcriptional regulator [Steroidobacteraceae bacterium]